MLGPGARAAPAGHPVDDLMPSCQVDRRAGVPYSRGMLGQPTKRIYKPGDVVDVSMTYDDYVTIPNDGRCYQLIEGELFVTPSPSLPHQRISRNLEVALATFVAKGRLGAVYDAPVDVILTPKTVLQPDL